MPAVTRTDPSPLVAGLATSLARTVVPIVVGFILSWALKIGLDLEDLHYEITRVIDGVVIAGYYAIVRTLETYVGPAWGWLLGVAKVPAYPQTSGTTAVEVAPGAPPDA